MTRKTSKAAWFTRQTWSGVGVYFIVCAVHTAVPAGAVELGIDNGHLSLSPFVGPYRQPLGFYHQIPIGTLIARPSEYALRYVHLKGTVSAAESIVRPNACMGPSELTLLTVEDESGSVVVVDA